MVRLIGVCFVFPDDRTESLILLRLWNTAAIFFKMKARIIDKIWIYVQIEQKDI